MLMVHAQAGPLAGVGLTLCGRDEGDVNLIAESTAARPNEFGGPMAA